MKRAPDTAEMQEPIDWDRLPDVPAVDIDYPPGFFEKLRAFGVGWQGQKALDVGTGTGMLARGFAREECQVTGLDISERRITLARRFAEEQGLNIEFRCGSAENTGLPDGRFELIAASNAWWYFEPVDALRDIRRLLSPEGRLLICGYRWLADRQDIARQTQELLTEFDIETDEPDDDEIPTLPQTTRKQFAVTARFLFEEDLRLTGEHWRWQILSRPDVTCGLSLQEQAELNRTLCALLPRPGETFEIIYRMFAVILTPSRRSRPIDDL